MKRIIVASVMALIIFSALVYAGSVHVYKKSVSPIASGGNSGAISITLPSPEVKVHALKLIFLASQTTTQIDIQIYQDIGLTKLQYEALNAQISNDCIIDETPFWLSTNASTNGMTYAKITNDGAWGCTIDKLELIMESMHSIETSE